VILHISKTSPTHHIVITFAMISQRIVASPPGQIVFPFICLNVKVVCCAVPLQEPDLMTIIGINKHGSSMLDKDPVGCKDIVIARTFYTSFGCPSRS